MAQIPCSQYDTIMETLDVPITDELLENIQKHIHLMKIAEDEEKEKANFSEPIKGAKVPGFRKQVEYGEKKRIKP